ncbi:unnamed protein product [Lupinus luteus]|uniref:Protein GLUTAMINE DUMPER 3 n=1 Tax=Lupinus luteus TaxID=3873 RepID=A0AAV1WCM6_LUPLU
MASVYIRRPMHEAERAPLSSQQPQSPWRSPVPYLFGGLAAMMGLIAFSLLILACSYWKLSSYLEDNGHGGERDVEAGDPKNDDDNKSQKPYEEKILVIMAGQQNPTFLATHVSSSTSRSSSFGANTTTCTCDQSEDNSEEVVKHGSGGDNPVLQSENRENSSDRNC